MIRRLALVPACALALSASATTAVAAGTATAATRATAATLPTETTAPSTVEMRIEGADQTLFEGPVESEGGYIQASSDTQPRQCDGTNEGANPTAGATATKTAVDAMQIVGQTFDGDWDSAYDDYSITRFGPDSENDADGYYWGVLDNDVFTSGGGCETEVADGDQVLWQYDAFGGQPFLKLEPAGDGMDAAPPLTVDVVRGRSLALQVDSYTGDGDGYTPASGVEVAPVTTAKATGYETVDTTSKQAVTTNSSGIADLRFSLAGWHRLKAAGSNDTPTGSYLRSNRIDVCVEKAAGAGCGPLPSDDQVRCVAPVSCTPVVTSVFLPFGRAAGGNKVTITGTNFVDGATVDFGGAAASNVTIVSDTTITATAPAGSGTVDVTVKSAGGTSATSANDHYTYRG